MSDSRKKGNEKIDEVALYVAYRELVADIQKSEDAILELSGKKKKIPANLRDQYSSELESFVSRLRRISITLFNGINIAELNKITKSKNTPVELQEYINYSNNFSQLVVMSILNQPDVTRAVSALERWIYISKMAFHENDLFTSGAILFALGNTFINKAQLESVLSATTQEVWRYYSNMLKCEPKKSLARQEKLLSGKFEVIPSLPVILNLFQSLHEEQELEKELPVNLHIAAGKMLTVRRSFTSAKSRRLFDFNSEDAKLIFLLKSKHDDKVLDSLLLSKANVLSSLLNREKHKLSILRAAKLHDKRDKLVLLTNKIKKVEDYEAEGKEEMQLCKLRSILCDPKMLENEMLKEVEKKFRKEKYNKSKLTKQFKKPAIKLLTKLKDMQSKYKQPDDALYEDDTKKAKAPTLFLIEKDSHVLQEKPKTESPRKEEKCELENTGLEELNTATKSSTIPQAVEQRIVARQSAISVTVPVLHLPRTTTVRDLKRIFEPVADASISNRSHTSTISQSVQDELESVRTARRLNSVRSYKEILERRIRESASQPVLTLQTRALVTTRVSKDDTTNKDSAPTISLSASGRKD